MHPHQSAATVGRFIGRQTLAAHLPDGVSWLCMSLECNDAIRRTSTRGVSGGSLQAATKAGTSTQNQRPSLGTLAGTNWEGFSLPRVMPCSCTCAHSGAVQQTVTQLICYRIWVGCNQTLK